MKSFREYILEMARTGFKQINPKDLKLDDIHKKEVHSKDERLIGDIDGINVYKSIHAMQSRDEELVPRDYHLKDSVILKAIKKAIKKGFSPKSGKTMVTFKNKDKKYDLLELDWRQNTITIITIIQSGKRNPKEYFTSRHSDETQITTENINENNLIVIDD